MKEPHVTKLKEKIEEFAAIAKALPENLQVICFELLLRNHLEQLTGSRPSKDAPPNPSAAPVPPTETKPPAEAAAKQDDVKQSDLHLKAKKFLEKYGISLEQINNLFFKEDSQLKPLYDDLKTTKMSESQIRVTLLLALRAALTTGEFEADVEVIREECIERKCYDSNNFGNNFNNNKGLFDFDKYTRDLKSVKLSESGRKLLAETIKDLQ